MSANLDQEVRSERRRRFVYGYWKMKTHAMVSNGDMASFGALRDS